jgi:ABC-2 type transport system ATP-binding protein
MNVIEVQSLTKVYTAGKVVALREVSLSIQRGEIYALLGPNGAGKTTLFKVLLGISRITSGAAQITGFSPSDPRSRQKVGYLPENHRFPSHLTGLGLLRLTGQLYGCSRDEIRSRANELLDLVGMTRWADVKMKRYSKGMSQRIGLAQAMISDPEILLLDEPTDGVDPVGKIEMREVLKQVRAAGRSVVLNSHLLSEVESAADRVAILSEGRVLRVGSVDELTSRRSHYEIEGDFGSYELELPESIGRVLAKGEGRMTVELSDEKEINYVIDELRREEITIRSVKPMRISLEQSFLETVLDGKERS